MEELGTWRDSAPPPGTCLPKGDGKEANHRKEEVKLVGQEEVVERSAVNAV